MRVLIIGVGVLLASCSPSNDDIATLYRNSPLDYSLRVHFATFDAPDGVAYNIDNCRLVEAVMNANVEAATIANGGEHDERLGFWCERGSYKEEGPTPSSFFGRFPSQ